MAVTPKNLYIGQPNTTIQTLYTVPASTKTIIKNILLCNTTSSVATITLHLVPNGSSAINSNKLINSYSVQPNETIIMDLTDVLEAAYTIQALQGTSSAITIKISGIEIL